MLLETLPAQLNLAALDADEELEVVFWGLGRVDLLARAVFLGLREYEAGLLVLHWTQVFLDVLPQLVTVLAIQHLMHVVVLERYFALLVVQSFLADHRHHLCLPCIVFTHRVA